MLPAKEIMTREVLSIKQETSVIQTIDLLLENKISGLPVIDENEKIVGIISEKDLLNILFRNDITVNDKVKTFMTKRVISFDENEDVTKVCEFFLKNNARRVPITQNGKLAGVISRRDILKLILMTIINSGGQA